MPKCDATPNAITVGACGIVLAPRPMAGNRAVRVEMRNSSPPSLWLTTGAGRRRLDDRTYRRRRPPAPNNMMLHRGSGGLGLTLCPFLVPCTKCIQNVNVNVNAVCCARGRALRHPSSAGRHGAVGRRTRTASGPAQCSSVAALVLQ